MDGDTRETPCQTSPPIYEINHFKCWQGVFPEYSEYLKLSNCVQMNIVLSHIQLNGGSVQGLVVFAHDDQFSGALGPASVAPLGYTLSLLLV